jgi:hypothetical protein
MSGFIGKYVCWGDENGMFCWGRIKAEVVMNTAKGPKDAFVLDQRMTGPHNIPERIQRYYRDTLLQKDMIDVERDIFDRDVQEFESVSNDDLFLLMMDAEAGLESIKEQKSLGPWNMLRSLQGRPGKENVAAELLRKRMETIQDDVLKV